MNSPVQKIKERLSIEEVVSSYIKLEKTGVNLKAKCPFHNEKTPSFFISPDRGTYYCFGCGASGDIFTFVEEFEGLDFKGALKLLADRAGVPLKAYSKEMKEAESEKEKLYRAMEKAEKFFISNLETKQIEYLKSRGLSEKTIKDFGIGFAKDDWRTLYEHLKLTGFSDLEIERAGLIKKTEKGYYDRFRNRIMFPMNDSSGRVIAFSGRITGEGEPKYLNSPETPIFSKNAVLYGIDKAKDSIRKNNFSVLVEGQMDLILSHQAGYKNTIATSGTALSDSTVSKENVVSNLGLVRRLSENLVLAFDADKAGASATIRAGKIALSLGMDVKVVDMPDGVDPADLIGKTGSDAWREAIKNSKHVIEFLLSKVLKNYSNDTRKAGREIKGTILPFVNALESSIEKMHFIKKISDLSGISQNALQDDLKKIEQEFRYEKEEIKEAGESLTKMYRKDYIERKLLGIALWQQSLADVGRPELGRPTSAIDFKAIFEKLGEVYKKYEVVKQDLIFEAEVFYTNNEKLENSITEMFLNLEEENINEELSKKMLELRQTSNEEIGKKILKEINELNKKKENIKNNRK
ncbi:DNA primase [Candidatus Nomurabacteria bacterium RIFCSPHIGHO2_01_FULL_41_91]|uniref:DNA primase n=1 Tax=Candidatus Nomurabacteria bacterium RIFCSPLOWO2_12_FULL_41_10 TaxID=1801795 RepID=A0A1F6YDA2_9BACT|nr:MAG: DNA primase [Candidatus Nomurabacteria bacterium RIFCSPHIGHO2_01_FULL_41_91]OGI80448.1 MAG: DNA primase [Candidatus Nomurabacteria bacterium RIFCSPHIGHO2_02_FULL_41_52]OGI85114.1 MAG: DNA primase [Candidatus Nomurabacteria bacterium RIFCSPHIGHO2_12_FULL_42_19]OGI94073.1 MAG: DNA primase [Candidatus Nomurabacteria bacterium RIFCSPLOWO2_01_FULL_41_52]OGI99598.1 MAG: DNA primase [Candidatus Nomurabacteria bacterium RIFCSPLOWO2_02_FULL_42_24]OGJ04342.1 MAG: DNA primase [Candidatus Nomuraba